MTDEGAIENLSDPIGYLLDFTNPYYTALAGNVKARAKKDNKKPGARPPLKLEKI
jgi:hypothetical protein